MAGTEIKTKRKHTVDLLKSLAMFGVIAIHSCGLGYSAVGAPIGSAGWISRLFWGVLTRASVPVFLMCSGVLFFNPEKDVTASRMYTRYIPRVLAAMVFWGIAYKCARLLLIDHTFSVKTFVQGVKEVFLFNQEFHLYYLHIILLFYALVPIIRVFLKNASIRDVRYFLFIWFCLGILFPTVKDYPPFSSVTGIPLQWIMNMAYSSLGYGVLGYYIYYLRPFSKKAVYALAFLAGFAFVFFATWHFSVKNGALYQNFLEGMSVGVCLMAAGSFGFCSLLRFKDGKGIFQYVSGASFCMYLIHVFVIGFFTYIGLTISLFPEFFSIPVVVLANGLIGIGVYAVISRIPVINRWLI